MPTKARAGPVQNQGSRTQPRQTTWGRMQAFEPSATAAQGMNEQKVGVRGRAGTCSQALSYRTGNSLSLLISVPVIHPQLPLLHTTIEYLTIMLKRQDNSILATIEKKNISFQYLSFLYICNNATYVLNK